MTKAHLSKSCKTWPFKPRLIGCFIVWYSAMQLRVKAVVTSTTTQWGRKKGTNFFYVYHRLRGSASPVLTATGFVNGRWQFSTPHRINTPWPITKKFGTGDCVGGPYGCAKFGANPSMGGFWANGWNITNFYLFIPFFHQLTYRSDTTTDFHAWFW